MSSKNAESADEACEPGVSKGDPDRFDPYPDVLRNILNSQVLKELNVYPVFESRSMVLANPCGFPVGPTLQPPESTVAKLCCINHAGVPIYGSAFLITPSVLLTAAHNIWPPHAPTPLSQITVTLPGFSPVAAAYLGVSNGWSHGFNQDRDYGVIKLFNPIDQNVIGPLPPRMKSMGDLSAHFKATMAGYPTGSNTIFTNEGPFIGNTVGNLVKYQMFTCDGESGGPIYINDNGPLVAVAVQADQKNIQNYSAGPLIDQTACDELAGWVGYPVCV